MINERILKSEEQAVYALRSLYRRFGYTQYKMGKFEEYDLYARNKSFLASEEIITFTGAGGKLMALRPDVTLSIVKNSKALPGPVQKLCYNEYVYRMSKGGGEFKEIMQTGLECIGDISPYHICEVLTLAVKSLQYIDEDYILDISHAGLVSALLERFSVEGELRRGMLECIRAKNPGVAAELPGISAEAAELVRLLTVDYPDVASAECALRGYLDYPTARAAMDEFGRIWSVLQKMGMTDRINIDFSIANNMSYYSGVVFKGYIKGIPTGVFPADSTTSLCRGWAAAQGPSALQCI